MLTFITVFLSGDSSALFCSSECKVVLCCASLGCLDFLHFFHLHFPFNSAVLLENSILPFFFTRTQQTRQMQVWDLKGEAKPEMLQNCIFLLIYFYHVVVKRLLVLQTSGDSSLPHSVSSVESWGVLGLTCFFWSLQKKRGLSRICLPAMTSDSGHVK